MLHFHLHFFPDMPELGTSKFCKKVWLEVLCRFCWKFTSLSSSERIVKIR